MKSSYWKLIKKERTKSWGTGKKYPNLRESAYIYDGETATEEYYVNPTKTRMLHRVYTKKGMFEDRFDYDKRHTARGKMKRLS